MNIKQIREIVKNITFAPSNLDMGWEFQVKENTDGFLIRTSFKRPDTNTGKVGTGFGRYMFVDKNVSETGVVMTAWLCAELVVRHELMEAFLYKKVRILNPHKTVEELGFPRELGTNNAFTLFDINRKLFDINSKPIKVKTKSVKKKPLSKSHV